MLKDIFTDGIFALFNKVCYFGAKTLSILMITRELGIENGGSFILLVGMLEILRVLADFGVDVYVIRKYTEGEHRVELLGNVFCQKVITGFVFSSLFFVYCHFAGYDFNIYGPIAISLFFAMFFNMAGSFFQSLNSNKTLTPIIIIVSILVVIVLMTGYVMKVRFSAWYYLFVEVAFVSAVSFTLLKHLGIDFILRLKKISLRNIFSLYNKTKSIGINAIIVILYSRLDNFYIKHFDPANLASYGQVFRLIDPLVMISSVFSTVAYARFSHYDLRQGNHVKKIAPFILCVILYGLISSVVYYGAISLFGHNILIYTSDVKEIIICFLFVASIKCVNGALTSIIQSQGLYRFGLYTASVCVTVAIPLMYVLTLKHGAIGAVYSIITVESISLLLLLTCVFMMKKKVNNK